MVLEVQSVRLLVSDLIVILLSIDLSLDSGEVMKLVKITSLERDVGANKS